MTEPSVRITHPNLYRSLTIVALMFVALGLNFILTTPTFRQFDLPPDGIGAGFLILGTLNLLFLNVYRSLKAVRVLLIVGIAYAMFWGIGTTETAFQGKSSFQLFILYAGLAALQAPLLLEPFFNPATASGSEEEE